MKKEDNNDKVQYGYRLYGKGTDMEWQKGLRTVAEGTNSIDIGDMLALAGSMRISRPTDIKQLIKNEKLKGALEKLENIVNAIEAKNAACRGCL